MANFRQRALDTAIREINAKTDLSFHEKGDYSTSSDRGSEAATRG
jgi:hypothetical protein